MDFALIKPIFSSPVVVQPFNEVEDGYRNMLYVGASFTVYGNINTLTEFRIDGEKIDFETYHISYSATQSPSQYVGENKLKMINKDPVLTIQITTRPYITIFNNKMRAIISGNSGTNTPFKVKLKFTTGTEEEYNMIMANSDQGGGKNEVDLITITFAETR